MGDVPESWEDGSQGQGQGQQQGQQGGFYNPYGGGQGQYNPYGGGYNPYGGYDPYGGYNPYGGGYNPYGQPHYGGGRYPPYQQGGYQQYPGQGRPPHGHQQYQQQYQQGPPQPQGQQPQGQQPQTQQKTPQPQQQQQQQTRPQSAPANKQPTQQQQQQKPGQQTAGKGPQSQQGQKQGQGQQPNKGGQPAANKQAQGGNKPANAQPQKKAEPAKPKEEKKEEKKSDVKELGKELEKATLSEKADGGDEKRTESVSEPLPEEEEEVDRVKREIAIAEEDKREQVNIIFIGHVDAGKSTIGGSIMYITGQVDKRTLEKYEREAKEKNRESWYLSWALDTSEEERTKGITVECGKAHFTTEKKRFTIIDAPGHKSFVPNMLLGASEADYGILVISARKGEFETGFEKGGQTREHAMLAKTTGVKHLIVVINKMDEGTVNWAEERYNECKDKLIPYLKQVGFNLKKDVFFIPISGLTGANLKDRVSVDVCPWYGGPSLLEYLDSLPRISRLLDVPLRIPVTFKFKDMGTMAMGKIQSGSITRGDTLLVMPNKRKVVADSIAIDDVEVNSAQSGDNVRIKLKGIEEEDLAVGHVLCDPVSPCSVGTMFDAQVAILEYKSIICAGYSAVLHIHTAVEEATLKALIAQVDKKTGKIDKEKGKPRFVRPGEIVVARFESAAPICMETFKDHPVMGRFTLRDEGKTVGVGKILKLVVASGGVSSSGPSSSTE